LEAKVNAGLNFWNSTAKKINGKIKKWHKKDAINALLDIRVLKQEN
jgi:hypothetical protein